MTDLPDTFREVLPTAEAGPIRTESSCDAQRRLVPAFFVFIIAGYLILDDFDMASAPAQCRWPRPTRSGGRFLNSIGPVWDGNEVWLVLGGGVLFAVFPLVYASMFSGFYLAFMFVLLVLILRTVALEFRSKEPSPRWRATWDAIFGVASAGLALLFGVAFGNVLSGVPIDADGNMRVSLIDLLTPFALLVGVTTVFMFAMHGSIYLTMKTEASCRSGSSGRRRA
jgi:cytochrome d ubiquinol oxidase subunit II